VARSRVHTRRTGGWCHRWRGRRTERRTVEPAIATADRDDNGDTCTDGNQPDRYNTDREEHATGNGTARDDANHRAAHNASNRAAHNATNGPSDHAGDRPAANHHAGPTGPGEHPTVKRAPTKACTTR